MRRLGQFEAGVVWHAVVAVAAEVWARAGVYGAWVAGFAFREDVGGEGEGCDEGYSGCEADEGDEVR